MDPLVYTFGGFQIDDQSRLLLHDGLRVPIPPKAADLLIVLVERNGELIGRDELIKTLWPDTFVEDNNLAKHIFSLRKILGLNTLGAAYIETVPKRGYRFVGDVDRTPARAENIYQYQDRTREEIVIEERYGPAWSRLRSGVVLTLLLVVCLSAAMALRLRGKATHEWRSVLIQPFTASGEANPAFGAAFAQEVAARLRTVSDLRVVTPLSPINANDVSKQLSADTILSGRLELAEGRGRVAAQLVSAQDGAVLWAEDATDIDSDDLRATLTRLASSIASRLLGRLPPMERARLARRGSPNADAYQAFLRGQADMLRNSLDQVAAPERAIGHFETAIRLDPGFADAWAALARGRLALYFGANANPSLLAAAAQDANRALSIDPENLVARHALIRVYNWHGKYEDMVREAKRMLEVNASDPETQSAMAFVYRYTSMLDRAIDQYERYLAAYPDDENAWFELVHACLFAKAYDRGIRHAQKLLAIQRLAFPSFLLYFYSGDVSKAVALARQALTLLQGGTPAAYLAPLVLHSAGLEAEARADWERAAERFERRLNQDENERIRIFLAAIYARLGRPVLAREQIRRSLDVKPGEPVTRFFAAEVYALLDDRPAAFESLREGIAGGFIQLPVLDYYAQEPNGLARFREDREYLSIRDGMARRIAELRARF